MQWCFRRLIYDLSTISSKIRDEDVAKIVFRTRYGYYEFLVMLFGLSNVPAAFIDLMNIVLKPLLYKFVVVFIEDILIYSKSQEEHKEHLAKVLKTLRQQKLFVKFNKCDLWRDNVSFLGHVVSKDGVSTDPQKVEVVSQWSKPTNVLEI